MAPVLWQENPGSWLIDRFDTNRLTDVWPRLIDFIRRRRTAERYPYPAWVIVDGRLVQGRDISRDGLSVYTADVLSIGRTVMVTLSGRAGRSDELSNTARVVAVTPEPAGFRVHLRWIG